MKRFISLLAAFVLLTSNLLAQDLRKKAEENPLDCAIYLFFKDKDLTGTNDLIRTLDGVKRYDDLLKAIESYDDNDDKIELFARYAKSFIKKKKFRLANLFLDKAFSIMKTDEEQFTDDKWTLSNLIESLVFFNRLTDVAEIINHQDEDTAKIRVLTVAADHLQKKGNKQLAIQYLFEAEKLAMRLEDFDELLTVAKIFANLGRFEKTKKVLQDAEKLFIKSSVGNGVHRDVLKLIPIYFQINQNEKAMALWQEYGLPNKIYELEYLVQAIVDYQGFEKAKPYLLQIRQNRDSLQQAANRLVKIYLKRGDFKTAIEIAKEISAENDSYAQQAAFISIADKFIAVKNRKAASSILDFAFQRAKKINYEHPPEASVGASPGSRKEIYLGQIYRCLIELKQFEKAFSVFNSVNSDHTFARVFIAEKLVDFAKLRNKNLPSKEIEKLLTDAQEIVKDEEYYSIHVKLLIADFYAQTGIKDKAVKMLSEAIVEGIEDCCNEYYFLMSAGQIFEQNKLKADDNLKKVLREIISKYE